MGLRCVYTDLDGTLLGDRGSLFRDADGGFSLMQARALEACHRAGAEVVIMSGRREAQVMADARLLGQTSYIYEAGCGVVIEGERTFLTGDWIPDDEGTPAERMIREGIPDLLFARFPDRLEWHRPWHKDRVLSHLFRGLVDVEAANAVLAPTATTTCDSSTTARSPDRWRAWKARHTPTTWCLEGRARQTRSPGTCGRGDMSRGVHRGRRLGRGPRRGRRVGRFFVVANGPESDPGLRDAIAGRANATVTEGRNGDGVYEAVVCTLAERP